MGRVAKQAPSTPDNEAPPYKTQAEPWWTADGQGKAILQAAERGPASYADVPLMTYPQMLAAAVKTSAKKPALAVEEVPPLAKGQKDVPPPLPLKKWKTWTWAEYEKQSRDFAKACIAVGHEHFDAVNIFGFNSPQWAIGLSGAMMAGGKAAGIYPSDTAESVKYKSDHSNGSVALVENKECLAKFKEVADDLPYLKAIVTWDCDPGEDIKTADGRSIVTHSFVDFLTLGAKQEDTELDKRIEAIDPGHCCCLVYTSGTTGRPKAVMLSHDNLHFSSAVVSTQVFPKPSSKAVEQRVVSYLPLSHVAGMMVDLITPVIYTKSTKYKGHVTTYFARPYDLKKGSLVERLKGVRPTLFLGVPRVWEKIMEKLKQVGATTKGLKRSMANYAKKRAALYTSTRQLGGKGTTPKTMGFANILLNKIKGKLGIDKAKFTFSGAAPLSREVLEFFGALAININEVYGMSETSAVATWSTDTHHVWGSVGYEVPGCQVRVFQKGGEGEPVDAEVSDELFNPTEAQQGEICFRGRMIMMGYMANERLGKEHVEEIEGKNADCIDKYGWLHSGDKGTKDKTGMFKITGRYKELIIGAGGENIAPVPIEDELKKLCPFVSNVMMIGNKRKFNVMILTLKAVGATGELPGGDKLDGAAAKLSDAKTISEALNDEGFSKAIEAAIREINVNTEIVPSNAAKVQKFTILPRDFSVVTGELTATLKLKRTVAEEVFLPIIDRMYEVEETYVNYNSAPTPDLDFGPGAVEPITEKQLSMNFNKEVEEAAELVRNEEETAEEKKE